ncbi:23.6 kDa heat shock protein, mitochondrial-like [Rhodamnia argentea]|uniref:23.6 kDa heat shock protein, mitochondrial-like n=1 Tax=Rhodamnia argentea TaxID=178133 RepID=A0A8B8PV72_9MYRT|nr:23.6 kDa heat shock protein, mitochondrial-like [Rhodamnia argentea]
MASRLALRRALASAISGNKLASPVRSASVAPFMTGTRSFNTGIQVTRADEGSEAVDVDRTPDRSVSRRRDRSLAPFSDFFDPFAPTRSLSQVLNLMDQLMEDPLQAFRGGSRRGWEVKEDDKALQLRIDMPGLSKGDVKVVVEQNTLIIRGEGGDPEAGEEGRRRYSGRIDLPPNVYKLDEIKAEMRNGVLKIVVPKAQEGERKDVLEVPVA